MEATAKIRDPLKMPSVKYGEMSAVIQLAPAVKTYELQYFIQFIVIVKLTI